jgi:uncharacterized protein (TIGR02466 family)
MKNEENFTESYNIIPLFPTPVGEFRFENNFSKKEINFIQKQELTQNTGNDTSKNNYILTKSDELSRIRKFAINSVNLFYKEIYKPKTDVNLYITQSWCNYTKTNQFHHPHTHPNSIISGVLYIDGNDDSDRIIFVRDVGHQQIKVFPAEYNAFNAESWWLPAKSKTLYLFPSSLMHRVEPVKGDKTRISISFNTFVTGQLGTNDTLTELKLDN